jgi:hypothetical protein
MRNSIVPVALSPAASGDEILISVAATKRTGSKRLLSAMMLAMAAFGGMQEADASIVTITVTGTISNGVDNTGLFGPPKSELDGQSFKLVFTFDDTKGKQENSPSTCTSGITNEGLIAPLSSPGTAVLQIGSGTWEFGALPGFSHFSQAVLQGCGNGAFFGYDAKDEASSGGVPNSITGSVYAAPGDLPTPGSSWEDAYSYTYPSAQLNNGSISFSIVNVVLSPGGVSQNAFGTLVPVSFTISGPQSGPSSSTGLQFVPVTPCRVADTRNATGPFGGPELGAGSSREFDIPQSACSIPSTAVAYSLNVTAVPNGPLGYLTLWPSGQTQPTVSTLNSDGRVKANAAIVPAGTNGGVSVYVTNPSQVILDIDGYFVPAGTASALAFYPLTPCRVVDTRNASGALGGPTLAAGASRNFPLQSSSCSIPSDATAYSLNVTAIPNGSLGYLTMWPSGQTQPLVSTLNAPTGAVTANGAIVPAGSNGDVSVYVSNASDVVLDVNGYFAAPGANGLSLYTTTPCRVLDTRSSSGAFNGTLGVEVESSSCAPSSTAQAYVLNATVVPSGSLGYLTLWPAGETQPVVSTLNAGDGAVTSNMAIVPTMNGSIDAFSSNSTELILDISSYFAP